MCLAVPARVIALLPGQRAQVDLGGVVKEVSVALVDDLAAGDYVILHVGHALSRLDAEEAERTLALIADLAASGEEAESEAEAEATSPPAPPSRRPEDTPS